MRGVGRFVGVFRYRSCFVDGDLWVPAPTLWSGVRRSDIKARVGGAQAFERRAEHHPPTVRR